ncbi:MAG: PorT family protein [Bacteroidetes bacterium]|nr:PorT family protein [Bacteroidota bacterium]
MKTIKTAVVLGLIFLSTSTFGQSDTTISEKNQNKKRSAQTHLDVMVQMTSSNLNYGSAESSLSDYKKSIRGLQAGFSFQAGVTPAFSVVSELYYMRKGGSLKANNPLNVGESTIKINSIELPMMARLHVGKLYLNAGPSIAYNFSGSRKFSDETSQLNFSNSIDGFKRWDASIQVGGGFSIPTKKKTITLDVRYVHGLSDIANAGEIKTRSVMVSVRVSKPWKSNPFAKKQFKEGFN